MSAIIHSVSCRRVALFVTAAAIFDLAYGQAPLFDGTYNTYFAHGLALAGVGSLSRDWFAGTTDPFPIFTAIVALTHRAFGDSAFHVLHAAILGVYILSLTAIADACFDLGTGLSRWGLTALLTVLHSLLFRRGIERLTGADWGYYVHAGLAWQSTIWPMFLPSVFGVFNVASVAAFLRGRDRLAVVLTAVAVYVHFSYVLTGAALVVGYAWVRAPAVLGRDEGATRSWNETLRILATGALAFIPLVAFVAFRFRPTSHAIADEARRILADLRLPHHARPEQWVAPPTEFVIQGGLLGLSLLRLGSRPLRTVLLVVFAVGAALTAAQMATGSRILGLLFPWRCSALLVPLSTTVLAGSLVAAFRRTASVRRPLAFVSMALAGGAAVYGYMRTLSDSRRLAADPSNAVMAYVRRTASPDALYLIPEEMQRFRLEAAVRTYVDWKSHPYRDVEVIEWFRRVERVRALAKTDGAIYCESLGRLAAEDGVTQIVAPANRAATCAGLVTEYKDAAYVVERIGR
jgi:hypothetical protein